MTLAKANKKSIDIVPLNDVAILSKKGTNNMKEYTYEVKIDNMKLPLNKGDEVGKLIVKNGTEVIKEAPLTVTEDVKNLSFLELFKNTLLDTLTGNMSYETAN